MLRTDIIMHIYEMAILKIKKKYIGKQLPLVS